jgi:hypothetical protein
MRIQRIQGVDGGADDQRARYLGQVHQHQEDEAAPELSSVPAQVAAQRAQLFPQP